MSKVNKKAIENVQTSNDVDRVATADNSSKADASAQLLNSMMSEFKNMFLELKQGQDNLRNDLNTRIDELELKNAGSTNAFSTPIKQIDSSPSSAQTTATQFNLSGSSISKDRSVADKDLHPILNLKLDLEKSTVPKLSDKITADEYINWYNKLKETVLANPRFMYLLSNPAEDAWKLCGGYMWTHKLIDNDVDLYRWESSFISSLRYLFAFISHIVPEDIIQGIRLQMQQREKDKYNVPVRLKFRSAVTMHLNNSDNQFYQDVYSLMKILEERYNVKDCNRLIELIHAFKRIHLNKYDHPQSVFMKYNEMVNRIRSVYPLFPDYPESWICFDILTRVSTTVYGDAVKELFRQDVQTLTKDKVLSRLIADYTQYNRTNNVLDAKNTNFRFSGKRSMHDKAAPGTSTATAAAAIAPNNSTSQYSAQRLCYRCNLPGHMAFNCPQKLKNPVNQSAERAEIEEENYIENDDSDSYNDNTLEAEFYHSSAAEEGYVVEEFSVEDMHGIEFPHAEAQAAGFTSVLDHQAIPDSGSAVYLTGDRSKLINLRRVPPVYIHGVGGYRISNTVGDMIMKNAQLVLRNVRFVPGHPNTLISLGRLSENGFQFFSHKDKIYIVEEGFIKPPPFNDPRIVTMGYRRNGLYVVNITEPDEQKGGDKSAERVSESEIKAIYKKAAEPVVKALTPQQLMKNKTTTELRKDLEKHRTGATTVKSPAKPTNPVGHIPIPKINEAAKKDNNINNATSQSLHNETEASVAIEEAYAGEVVGIDETPQKANTDTEALVHRRFGHVSSKQL